eukprot:CAMPEP_0172712906 /NCGR_PEP_ID=MMETSP1074-20121228/61370_1 /TAXON_ID=2916 /ORGANISM="Ceratium fusus, Strain PA161109" /LENGTH=293 /DNA_ID=CAMNT_0013536903 /DNA_START=54 /DNA_END=935 /DNA_ORIENTATION=+
MSKVIATIASFVVLVSSTSLRGKTFLRQDPDVSGESQGDSSDSSDSSLNQFLTEDDGREGSSTNSDDSGAAEMVGSQAVTADDHVNNEEPDMSVEEDDDSMPAAVHGNSSGTMAHKLLATDTDDNKDAEQSNSADSSETEDADATVSASQDDSPTPGLTPAGDAVEQMTATLGDSDNTQSDDNDNTEHLNNPSESSPRELVAPEGDNRSQGTSMVVNSGAMESDDENDDAEPLASQSKLSHQSTQELEGPIDDDKTSAVSATGDDSDDAATVQLKENVESDSEDTSDDTSSSA